MNPVKYAQMMKYLTRAKKQKPDLSDVFPASEAPIPPKTQTVEEMEAINAFIRRERQQKAGGGMLVQPSADGSRPGYADEKKYKRFKKSVNIDGTEYGIITKKNDLNFGKYVYRGNKGNEYFDDIKDLKARIEKGGKGRKFTGYSKGYLAELEDIKEFVDNKGAKNIFLSDLVEKFGDVTKETSDDAVRDSKTEKKIKIAIGEDEYKKLIKGGERAKTSVRRKKDANALVRAVKRGEKPLIALSSEMTGEAPNVFKDFLNKTERNMYDSIIPKLKAIVSRVTQPRQIYQATDAVEELKKTTTKTFNQIIKKYPQAQAARNVLTSGKGIVAYNDRSYILSQLFRHVQNGGTKYKYVSGDTTATIKFRNNETGKLINLNNIDVNDPEFKEAADAYNQKQKIMNTEIDDPRIKGSKIKIGQAIAANGDSIVIDHLDDVKNNPLKNLVITNQKANMAATIKGATEAELKSIGRGLKLSTEDNIKRFSNYAKRVLISPESKRPTAKETIFTKTGTLRGVTDPPDTEIKRLIASFGGGSCPVEFGPKNRDGGRIGYQLGTTGLKKCIEQGARNINEGKFKTADQVQDAAKLLSGGKNVLRAITKYGIIPEAAFVAGESLFRTALGETPFNSLLKSIDSFTFGATDFGSGIDAEKFGKFADQKLAVDKFRNSQAKVDSLQNKLSNLKAITDQGGEGYVGDLTSDIQMTQAQLQAAEQELQKNTVSSDLVQFIDRRGQEIADSERAKSDSAKRSLTDQMEGIPGIRDYTDTESTRIFPTQPSQTDLNLDMFPTLPTDIMTLTPLGAENLSQYFKSEGKDFSAEDILAYRDELKQMPLSQQAQIYGDEQIYGTQGAEALQPLAGGGIAKLAGVSSGPPPESGPNSQGLQGLLKRGMKI